MNAGLGIPGGMQHLLRHIRGEILTIEHVPLQGVNARAVAGDQKGIKGQRTHQVTHLQHMSTGGEGKRNVALTQSLEHT